jgi:hypothetical protein
MQLLDLGMVTAPSSRHGHAAAADVPWTVHMDAVET